MGGCTHCGSSFSHWKPPHVSHLAFTLAEVRAARDNEKLKSDREMNRENQLAYLEYFFGRSDQLPIFEGRNDLFVEQESLEHFDDNVGQVADVNLEDFLSRLFGDKYGAGVISSENLRSADSLPAVVKQEKVIEKVDPEPEVTSNPVIPLDDLLMTIFGPRYGTGELSPVRLRPITDFENLTQSTPEVKLQAHTRHESPIPPSADPGQCLLALFGEMYGSGNVDTSHLRSKDDLPEVLTVPVPVVETQPSEETSTESPACVSLSERLIHVFGDQYGTGQLDTSKLRSADELTLVTHEVQKLPEIRQRSPSPVRVGFYHKSNPQ